MGKNIIFTCARAAILDFHHFNVVPKYANLAQYKVSEIPPIGACTMYDVLFIRHQLIVDCLSM